jgi:UPF0271 protein
MLEARALVSVTGRHLPTDIDSLCVHGDGAEAVATARAVRAGLAAMGVAVVPLPERLLRARGQGREVAI